MSISLFDTHCDTITAAMAKGEALRRNSLHVDLARGARYSQWAQVFAIFTRPAGFSAGTEDDFSEDAPPGVLYSLYGEALSRLKSELSENSDIMTLCLSAEDVKAAASEGKAAAFISVEGAELLKCSIDCLWEAYEAGVRLVNITWNYDNILSGTAMGPTKSGLTDKGRDFIRCAQSMGVICDMSHISERAFWDAAEISAKPLIASHSNSKAVCDHPRNLTDGQFREIARLGGAAGINLCADFLGDGADIETVVRHIDHFLSLGGEKAVAVGGDLDGVETLPKGISGIQDMGLLFEELLRRNYSESLVRDIFFNNWMEVFERALA